MTGPLWPGCRLPNAEDLVSIDLEALQPSQLLQLAQQLGLPLGLNPSPADVLKALRASELDEYAARG